jgi:pyruvate dehydrogenase E1 component alpha subunit
VIEAKTYRKGGHSRADPGKYRPPEEVEAWLARDPVELYRKRLEGTGIGADVLDGIDAEVRAAVDRATEEAKAAPPPPLELIHTHVWADGGSSWRN